MVGTIDLAIRTSVRALVWACRFISRLLVARTIVAVAIVAASLTIAAYALWIGAILWMVTGRFGVMRSTRRRLHVEVCVAIALIVGLVVLCASQGRPPANLAVIASCALGGAIVWFHRDVTIRALRAEFHAGFRRTPTGGGS